MKKAALIFLIIFPITFFTYADIAPNPIQVKGIVPFGPMNIQMVSEVVKVDMSMDSSIVECTFNMRNLGEAEDIQIGFPIMYFYLYTMEMDKYLLNDPLRNNFAVEVNGRIIKKIDMYVPDNLKEILKSYNSAGGYNLLDQYTNQNKPWYLWKVHFKKGESQVIKVRYVLPNGATHQCRFFNYLLSTGAGWKGNIERAQVIVNVKGIPLDQIVAISPKHYSKSENTISWDFRNIKPTINNDILIKYEMVKGSYKAEMAKLNAIQNLVDDHKADHDEINKMDPNMVAAVRITRDHPYEGGAILIYTKPYVLKNFKKKVKSIDREVWKQIATASALTFPKDYEVIIDSQKPLERDLFEDLMKLSALKTFTINIISTGEKRKTIVVNTK